MKTIFDKVPLLVNAGETVSFSLPAPFHLQDSLFLLAHHSLGQVLTVTLTSNDGDSVSQNFTLESYPAILAFSKGAEGVFNKDGYHQVSFTSFHEVEGSLTYRVKNPERVMTTFRKA
jgi:hypothetical protein